MHSKFTSERGRSLLETVVVVALIGLITYGIYSTFTFVLDKANAHVLEEQISRWVVQRRHVALTSKGSEVLARTDNSTNIPLEIKNGVSDEAPYILIKVGSSDSPLSYDLCERLLKSPTLNPVKIRVGNVFSGCTQNMTSATFYFFKGSAG